MCRWEGGRDGPGAEIGEDRVFLIDNDSTS